MPRPGRSRLLGADPVPRSSAEAQRLIRRILPELHADARTRAFRDLVLKAPAPSLQEAPVQRLLMNAAVDLMPDFARDLHQLRRPALRFAVRGGTFGIARTLRWAFTADGYRGPH